MADDRVLAEMPLLIADLYEAAGAARARGERIAARAGQTQARWQVLSVLSQGDWSVAQAARRLGVARQGVQRLVNELERAGLVRYEPNPRHLRSPLVRLSDDGHAVLAQITGAARGWHRTAAEQITQTLAGEPGWARVDTDQVRAALHDLEQGGEITVQRDATGDRYQLLDTGGG